MIKFTVGNRTINKGRVEKLAFKKIMRKKTGPVAPDGALFCYNIDYQVVKSLN